MNDLPSIPSRRSPNDAAQIQKRFLVRLVAAKEFIEAEEQEWLLGKYNGENNLLVGTGFRANRGPVLGTPGCRSGGATRATNGILVGDVLFRFGRGLIRRRVAPRRRPPRRSKPFLARSHASVRAIPSNII